MISVIVPIFNIQKYLRQCIDSILNQSYKNIEVILVDDGSTDGSSDICDEYVVRDSRIKVLHKKNEGLVKARKDGLTISSGEYIGYVDGDDWIEPNMFEHLYNALNDNDVDIAMCGRFEDTGETHRAVYHGFTEGRYDKQELLDKVYPNMIVNGAFFEWGLFPGVWDKLFRRTALEPYQMAVDNRLNMGEDAACTYPAILNANSIYVLHECLYHYRQTSDSMVKKQINVEKQRKNFNILYNSVYDLLCKYKGVFDLTEQWKEYILFLMVPRADVLYEDINKLEFLFPFSKVKKCKNIIIYGMGTYGQLLYRYLKYSKFCNVVACADRNFTELRKQGLEVIDPIDMDKYEFDFIVIANSFAKVRNSIYEDLSKRFPVEKLQIMDEELIRSDETLKAFGLI